MSETTSAAPATSAPIDESVGRLFGAEGRRVFASRLERLAQGPLDEEGAELEFSVELAIELAAVCNLACVMCPVPSTRRPKQLMDDVLFRRLIDQAHGERGFVLLPQAHQPTPPAPGRGPCRMLWRNLSVHADGKVSACCHDSEDELIVGDVAAGETLQEIWRGPALRRLRRLHLEGRIDELPICWACRNWYR